MKEDILALLLQAESEYRGAMKKAAKDAEQYADDRRSEQTAYIGEMKRHLRTFEKTESEKLEQMLAADNDRMEEEAAELKRQMKERQESLADQISERLKEEVLSLLWR